MHLGVFANEETAAKAYDRATISKGASRGQAFVTNFDISCYKEEVDILQELGPEVLKSLLSDRRYQRGSCSAHYVNVFASDILQGRQSLCSVFSRADC